MRFTKLYSPREINFHLLPDLMEKIRTYIEGTLPNTGYHIPKLTPAYLLKTNSQVCETLNPDEFRDILRNLTEPVLTLDAALTEFFYDIAKDRDVELSPDFKLTYGPNFIEIIIARTTAENIKTLFSTIEEQFMLESVKPSISEEAKQVQRTIFLAHSFDQRGKSYAYEVTKFLNLTGFTVLTGEGYSPESISKKVKKRLTAQEVVIVVASETDDTTWITQETTGATFTDKPVMMLIEEGIEFKPGMLGDLEFIRFQKDSISSTFIPILEGLQELGYKFS